ncbi:DUF2167 domain-containing protein [Aliiglaciecola sp. LCG003]|uniref:DUF2167 domain-containing protein n=1 Tax=Aliiglaciecola sp. LCG003 TaxID=3053655 RepID=UPI0025747ED0|nr:DUF2167 domain-containing protein [Aliiglaciecola sp. LCG003]WJG09768.1 DUF2167 domain-containing protein [Aliiglaciecola sp. LCG003]
MAIYGNIKAILSVCLVLFFTCSAMSQNNPDSEFGTASQSETLSAEEIAYYEWATTMLGSLDRKQGIIELPGNVAKLDVPQGYYFLDAQDAEKVLEQVWGNPEGSSQGILGMLFPSEYTPFDSDSWGVTVKYEEDGYVSDENAADIDYDNLLSEMQADFKQDSQYRVENGFEPIELVGWAAKPYYDDQNKKLHWAKEIRFGESSAHTLNYNIRVLGRQGVLVLNFVAGMEQLDIIDQRIAAVLDMADFKEGSRYADFDPDIDDVAAYGIGALVAGKVVAKTGLFAAALIFLKKFGVFILIGVGALVRKVFAKGKNSKSET